MIKRSFKKVPKKQQKEKKYYCAYFVPVFKIGTGAHTSHLKCHQANAHVPFSSPINFNVSFINCMFDNCKNFLIIYAKLKHESEFDMSQIVLRIRFNLLLCFISVLEQRTDIIYNGANKLLRYLDRNKLIKLE